MFPSPGDDSVCGPGDCLRYDGATLFQYDDHRGVDFAAPVGTVVKAGADASTAISISVDGCPDDGTDALCGGGFGNHVYLQHLDGNVTIYAHMQTGTPIQVGAQPLCGDPIGNVGLSGYTTGYHAHVELQTCIGCNQDDLDFFGGAVNGFVSYWTTFNDPNADCQNFSPLISVLEPDGVSDIVESSFRITWQDDDPDDDASIDLYYDDDPSTPGDGTLIIADLREDDSLDHFFWDTTAVPDGRYFVEARISDGVTSTSAYSPGPLVVSHCADNVEITDESIGSLRIVTGCSSVAVGPNVLVQESGNLLIRALRIVFRSGFSVLSGGSAAVTSDRTREALVPNTIYLIDALNDNLLRVDDLTSTSIVGPLDRSDLGGLAYDRLEDRLYTVDFESDELVELSKMTGQTLSALPLSGPIELGVSGITFGPNNVLYGITAGMHSNTWLVTIDTTTGTISRIGLQPGPQLSDIAYDHDTSRMFAISPYGFGALYEIDPSTAQLTTLAQAGLKGVHELADQPNTQELWSVRSRSTPVRARHTDLGRTLPTGGFSLELILGPQGLVSGLETVYVPVP